MPTGNLHLVPPGELAVGEGGRVRFIDEEQGVYAFETLPAGDDPPVWLREDDRETTLVDPLAAFLLQYVVFEATLRRADGWGYVDVDLLPALLAELPAVPLGAWPHPSGATLTFHCADDLIGMLFKYPGERLVEVHLAAHDSATLERLPPVIDWDA